MPKGKILMGKKTPAPIEKAVPRNEEKRGGPRYKKQPVPDGKRQPMPDGKKRALPMPRPKPGDNKKRPLPMPKPKPGKPAPKGGKVFERKLENNEQKKGGPIPLTKLRNRIPVSTLGPSQANRKPVMPPRRGR
jgi:hypothetical protein